MLCAIRSGPAKACSVNGPMSAAAQGVPAMSIDNRRPPARRPHSSRKDPVIAELRPYGMADIGGEGAAANAARWQGDGDDLGSDRGQLAALQGQATAQLAQAH